MRKSLGGICRTFTYTLIASPHQCDDRRYKDYAMRKLLFPIIACAFLAMACDDSSSDSNEPSTPNPDKPSTENPDKPSTGNTDKPSDTTAVKAGDKCDSKTFKSASCKTDENTKKTVALDCATNVVIEMTCDSDQACLVAEDKSTAKCFKGQEDVVDANAEVCKDTEKSCKAEEEEGTLSWSECKKMSDGTTRKFEYDVTCSLGCKDEKSCNPAGSDGVCNDAAKAKCEEGQKCATIANSQAVCYKETCGKDAPINDLTMSCNDAGTSMIMSSCLLTDTGVIAKLSQEVECECDKTTNKCKDSE